MVSVYSYIVSSIMILLYVFSQMHRTYVLSPPVTCTLVPGQWVLIKNVYFRARGGGAPAEYGGFHAQKNLP